MLKVESHLHGLSLNLVSCYKRHPHFLDEETKANRLYLQAGAEQTTLDGVLFGCGARAPFFTTHDIF